MRWSLHHRLRLLQVISSRWQFDCEFLRTAVRPSTVLSVDEVFLGGICAFGHAFELSGVARTCVRPTGSIWWRSSVC